MTYFNDITNHVPEPYLEPLILPVVLGENQHFHPHISKSMATKSFWSYKSKVEYPINFESLVFKTASCYLLFLIR